MKSILRQPILHFLALAGGLFLVFAALNPKADDHRRILVDDGALRNYLQFKSGAFDKETVQRQLDSLSSEQLTQLVDELVAQEALFREAQAIGLHNDDFVIRQRLIQKMQYLISGFDGDAAEVAESSVAEYYQQHTERYRTAPTATFTHVFISSDNHPDANTAATALLEQLNAQRIPFSAATGFGDRFAYHSNYVERSRNLIASHFGDAFAQALFTLKPDEIRWQGPIVSTQGVHLVLLTASDPGGLPALDTIYPRVVADTRQWLKEKQTAAAIDNLVDRYEVRIQHSYKGRNHAPQVAMMEQGNDSP
jgi:hypothetical protein